MPSRGAAAMRRVVVAAGALLLAGCGGPPGPAVGDGVAGPRYAAVPAGRRAAGPADDRVRRGQAIYRRERCDRCHTLFETPPAEGPFDLPRSQPPQPNASRVGPDLGREGHRHGDDWHYAHLYAPDVVVPGSRMPASRHLFETGGEGPPRPTADGEALVVWLQWLGREKRDAWAEFRAAEPEVPPPAGGVEAAARRGARGALLYAAECAACHGATGDGRGPAAGLFARPPRDFTLGRFRFRSRPIDAGATDHDLFRTITLGSGTGAAMPSFSSLPAEDRWALVATVRGFGGAGGGPIDATAPEAGPPGGVTPAGPHADPVAAGARLFVAWGCPSCHGSEAEGRAAPPATEEGAPAWRDEAGRPIDATGDLRHPCQRRGGGSPEALERALRFGVGTVMPSFATALDAEPGAAAAIHAWLGSLDPEAMADDARSPGGRPATGGR